MDFADIGSGIRELLALPADAPRSQYMTALARARDLARNWWGDSYVAMQAPVAWRTWEAKTTLLSDQEESASSSLNYPHPVEVVGLYPVIVPTQPNVPQPGLVVPTLDDVEVAVQWDQEQQATAAQDETGVTGRSSFVTASALSSLVPRLWCIRIESPNPVLTFNWRWKQGKNIFVDCVCTVATFPRPIPRWALRLAESIAASMRAEGP